MKRNVLKTILFLVGGVLTLSSCTKYNNPDPVFEEYEQEVDQTVKRKVLLISVDGLVGQELKKKVPAALSELMKTGKYSFEALTDVKTDDAPSWATLLTGYSHSRHHIENENYLPVTDSGNPHGEVNFVPSLIYRLEDKQPSTRTTIVVQDEGLGNVLLMDADDNIIASSDVKVKEEATALLSRVAPEFMVLQFKDVLKAGKESGFEMENPAYEAAVTAVDGHIADIVKTIKEREHYVYEDWLIIVSSTHGGVGTSYGGESYQERNVFTLYSQKDIQGEEIVPEIIVSPQFYGYDGTESGPREGVRARNLTEAIGEANYNAANTGKLTIEAKVKTNKNAGGNWNYIYPPFLSKVNNRSGSTPGWSFFRAGNNISFWCGDNSTAIEISGGPVSVNDQWAHITGTIEGTSTSVTSKLYVNGEKVSELTKNMNINNILSTSPLTFGFQPSVFLGGFINTHIADVHIWNTVLTPDEIRDNSRRVGVAENHAKLTNLVGYWPMNDGGPILKNKVIGMPDIPLQGNYQYKVLGNNLPFVDESAILMQNVDVASHVFYWLGITPNQDWALEGQVFLSKFEIEFLK